jgi:hypothetical protein
MIASILQFWPPLFAACARLAPGHNCKIDAIMGPAALARTGDHVAVDHP